MTTITFIDGTTFEVEKKDTNRLMRMVRRGGTQFRTLDSGLVINLDAIAMVKPDLEPVVTAPPVEEKPEKPVEPEEQPMHIGQLKSIMDNAKLSQAEFAKSIGYSPAAIRMAMKEGKVSMPLSNAIKKKYLNES